MSLSASALIRTPGRVLDRAPGWLGFALERLAGLLGVIAALVVAAFALVRLIPGDPARAVLGASATSEKVEQVRSELGLDRPIGAQFTAHVEGLLRGDLGESFGAPRSVSSILSSALPVTITVAVLATLLVLVVSVALGMTVAVACRNGRARLDGAFLTATALAGGFPEYVMGTVLVLVFAIQLGWLPVAGITAAGWFILPVIAVSVGPIATLSRIVRREMSTVLEADYMRTARAKRVSSFRLYVRHALPNVLTSTLTYSGLLLIGLLGGAVVIENVFNLPGVGRTFVEAVRDRDYPVVQGCVLALGVMAVVVTLVIDIVIGLMDPRARQRKASA